MSDLARILLAEDDPDIQELVTMSLEHVGGFEVIACDDGHDAIRQARRCRPDLILLDWMMPGMNGGEALSALRGDAATAAIPVVFMTAKARPEEVAQMRGLGALDVITKPFDPMTLPDTVRRIWADASSVDLGRPV